MATKNVAEVVIAGKILKITGYESMEYLHQIASYINDKISEFEQLEGYRRQSSDQKQIMLYMNLADDYFKSKYLADQQKVELDKKEKEMYSLKHDLIECQMAKEHLEKMSEEEAARLEGLIRERERQQEELQEQLESRQAQLKEAQAQQAELQMQLKEAQAQLEEQRAQLEAQQAQLEERRAQLEEQLVQKKLLQEQLEEARRPRERQDVDYRNRYNKNASNRSYANTNSNNHSNNNSNQ